MVDSKGGGASLGASVLSDQNATMKHQVSAGKARAKGGGCLEATLEPETKLLHPWFRLFLEEFRAQVEDLEF